MEKQIREFLVKRGCYASWYQDELVKIIREWEQSRQAAVAPALPLGEELTETLVRLKHLHHQLQAGNGGLSHDEYDEYEDLCQVAKHYLPISE